MCGRGRGGGGGKKGERVKGGRVIQERKVPLEIQPNVVSRASQQLLEKNPDLHQRQPPKDH